MTGLLPFAWVQKQGVFYQPDGKQPVVWYRHGVSSGALQEVYRVAGAAPLYELSDAAFRQKITEAYQQEGGQASQVMAELENGDDLFQVINALPENEDLLDCDDGAPVVRFINAMLGEAIKEGASDIHIEPYEKHLAIRFRVDGVLRPVLTPPHHLAAVLISRIKVMSRLDIAEKRVPQDGRITLRIGGRAVDVRVSTLPSRHGERIVLRVLDKNSVQLDLSSLGLDRHKRTALESLLAQPHGIILVTGPTGSGKSTTLYAALNQINTKDRNIMTVEDPVEYELEGVGQTQVNPKVDMTFARGLRAILRQDPDVVMIGEIRDGETAKIAVQASLTGHLVLSTLHTNTAIGAVSRLRDMGVEPFLLASSLIGVLSQRLVRTLCPACRVPVTYTTSQLSTLGICMETPLAAFQPGGCSACNGHGYRGRTGIHELVLVGHAMRQAIADAQHDVGLEQLIRQDTPGIVHDGLEKIQSGVTSLEEVLRVTSQR
ncbi:type II secretion system ATPase GspE [Mangrovibacter plantisponsor]|uniref:Type II secretion system protein E n=1 Tax=Mangrovibacter plantisponsor TaxID=451513 RepID=A0A317PS88_9ENTR|nr:type II secretion system ATPase GspE [Mangrovibacter plantisponsor]PWW02656.1 general secretion pathway protein E [Mangrovibacter plantisponsor]